MKAVAYQDCLDISNHESLLDIELPEPVPGPKDLLVNVKAVSVNPVDTKVRKRSKPDDGEYKVLGWDVAGVVQAVGDECVHYKVGDEVWYAGAINRAGCNAELHCVDERIVGRKPSSLTFAQAAAMPLTTITAWELLFDRLQVEQSTDKKDESILVIGAAGGVGSMLVQLANKLTGLTVIGTASRNETQEWVEQLGADYVIDHGKSLADELYRIGIDNVCYTACLTRSDLHYEPVTEILQPFGKIGMIDDPGTIDISKMKSKSISLHWEFMYTRSMYETSDMIEQQNLLNRVCELVDQGELITTMKKNYGLITADKLKRAHQTIESGTSIGKIVLEGF